MDTIRINIEGDRQAGIVFEHFPDALYDDLREEIDALANELYARVLAAEPTRTGRLRSQTRVRIFADKDHIKGQVDIAGAKGSQDFGKAAALEYGAHNPTKVSAHRMRLDHAWGVKFAAPETVLVSAYTRTPDIQELAFERGSLSDMEAEVIARLNAVVDKATAEAGA